MAQFTGLSITGSSNTEIADALIALNRSMEYQMDGNLDSGNIAEVGGWRIGTTELMSKDFDVGLSTDDVAFNPVRFWAGSASKESAPWRVYQDGTMTATGATIRSNDTYPYLEFDSSNRLMTAYATATNKMSFSTLGYANPRPALEFWNNYSTTSPSGYIFHADDPGGNGFTLWSNTNMSIVATQGLTIFATTTFSSWNSIEDSNGQSLQQALNSVTAKFG